MCVCEKARSRGGKDSGLGPLTKAWLGPAPVPFNYRPIYMYMYKEPRKMFVGELVGELVLQHDCIQTRITVHKTIILSSCRVQMLDDEV